MQMCVPTHVHVDSYVWQHMLISSLTQKLPLLYIIPCNIFYSNFFKMMIVTIMKLILQPTNGSMTCSLENTFQGR